LVDVSPPQVIDTTLLDSWSSLWTTRQRARQRSKCVAVDETNPVAVNAGFGAPTGRIALFAVMVKAAAFTVNVTVAEAVV